MIDIRPTLASDQPAVEALLDASLGPDRQNKTAYRLREGVAGIDELARVATVDGELRGSIAYWPVQITLDVAHPAFGKVLDALLLGPLAVDPAHRGEGAGVQLMQETLALARQMGHRLVILVGDLDYYTKVGFHRDGTQHLRLPGPVDQDRVLMTCLSDEGFGDLAGSLERASASAERRKEQTA